MHANWLALFCIFCVAAVGQNQVPLKFVHFNESNGLSHFQSSSIIEDSNGFYWIGTNDGLNRFDGCRFMRYFHQSSNSQSICGNVITNVIECVNGEILVGTQSGISRYNARQNTFTTLFESNANGLDQQVISHIEAAKDGSIWVAYRHELYALDESFRIHRTFDKKNLNGSDIFRWDFDNRQRLWVNTSGKLNCIDAAENFKITNSLNNLHSIFAENVADFDFDLEGNLIIAARTTGKILQYNENLELIHSIEPPENSPVEWVKIFTTPSGKIWLVSRDNGLFCIENGDWIYRGIIHSINNPSSPSGNSFATIYEDSFGNTWFCADGALDVIYNHVLKIKHSFEFPESASNEDAPLHISSVTGTASTAWITTWGKGLGEIDLKSGQTRFFTPSNDKNNSYLNDVLLCGDELFVGNYSGCYRFNIAKKQFSPAFRNSSSLAVIHINRDNGGNIWMSSNEDRGLLIGHSNSDSTTRFNQYSSSHFYPHRNYSAWAQLADGRIVLGYNRSPGLAIYNTEEKQFSIATPNDKLYFNEQINCIHATDSELWIGNNTGLTRIHLLNGNRSHFARDQGLPANSVNALCTDPEGYLWIGSGNGLSRLDPKTTALMHFSLAGIASNHAISMLKYNSITQCLDAVTEFSYFSFQLPANDALILKYAPSILVCSLDGKNINLDQHIVSMSESDRMLLIEFSCPSNPALQGLKYEYKLEGLDQHWLTSGERQQISYSVLPAGNFTLLIRASLDGVHWTEIVMPLQIEVKPLFYKRLGFFIGLLVLVILLTLFIIQLGKRIQLKNLLAIQQVRNRIAADLHDDVASSLSSISILSEVALNKIEQHPERTKSILERIGENSRSLISDMSDMVWSVNPENDAPEGLGRRMQDFAANLLQEKGIVFHLETPQDDSWPHMSMQMRKNIFLIFKEALHNTFKHAGCSEIWIQINFSESYLTMSIRDNGRGFDSHGKTQGNGLKNMIARAEQIHGELQIDSEPTKGTSLKLRVNLHSFE